MSKLVVLILVSSVLFAQDSWSALGQLKSGDRIEVSKRDHTQVRGEFVRVSDDGIAFSTKGGEQSVGKADVKRVAIRDSSKRMRNLLLGAGLGVAVGLAIGAVVSIPIRNEVGECPECFAIPTLALGGLGALAGLPAGYRTIYKVK